MSASSTILCIYDEGYEICEKIHKDPNAKYAVTVDKQENKNAQPGEGADVVRPNSRQRKGDDGDREQESVLHNL